MNKINYKLIIAYVISVVLIAVYFLVLYLGMHPKVSKEYAMFYINHDLKIKAPEGSLRVKPGKRLFLDGKEMSETTFTGIGQGWSWEYTETGVENAGFCYTTEAENYLYFDEVSKDSHRISLHISEMTDMPVETTIFVNEIENGVYELQGDSDVVVEVPAESVTDGCLVLKLCPQETEKPVYVDYLQFD